VPAAWGRCTARATLEQDAANHSLNARFGQARSWKGYYLVQAALRLRIEEALPVCVVANDAAAGDNGPAPTGCAGCFANGSYAFTSAVLQSALTATSFEHLNAYQTASGSGQTLQSATSTFAGGIYAFTALLAGGGVRGGQVYGTTSSDGGYMTDKPVSPAALAVSRAQTA
jgi:hypothetical protein